MPARAVTSKAKKPSRTVKARAPKKATLPKKRATKLLTGGNPQIAKADGAAPVKAYTAALPGWKRNVGRALDALRSF